MISLLSKLRFVFDKRDKRQIFFLFIFILSGVFVEIFGFAVIVPFLIIIMKPEIINENVYINNIYEWVSPNTYTQFIFYIGLSIVIIFILKNAYLFLIQYYKFKFSTIKHYEITSRLFRSYLLKPYTFHLKRNSAQLLRNIGLPRAVVGSILLPLLTIISDVLLLISVLVILMAVNFSVSILVFFYISILSVTYFLVVKKKLRKFGIRQKDLNEILLKQFNQGLGSIKESKILGREYYFDRIYSANLFEWDKISKYEQSIKALPKFFIETALVILVIFIFLYSIGTGKGTESIILFMSFFGMASIRLMPSISRMNASLLMIRFYTPSFEEVFTDILSSNTNKNPIPKEKIINPISFEEEISMVDISFTYDEAKVQALIDFSINITKNSTVGFVGESGAGKTTTVDVLLGLLKPQKGKVTVDGINIDRNLNSWQRKAGYIPQQIYLMDDTIKSNIAFGIGEKELDMDKVNNAIRLAQLEKFIEELPNGLNTKIGELGVRLSGGQRQRIGIARALYHDPELLVMDEATAALDNETEYAFMEAIESLSGKRTIIIIAHRLTTVKNCDKIFFMAKGNLVSSGNYDELLKTCNGFKEMAKLNIS